MYCWQARGTGGGREKYSGDITPTFFPHSMMKTLVTLITPSQFTYMYQALNI
jgi:hypothetical protein